MRTPLRTFLLLLLLQAVPGRMLLSLIATSVPKGHRRHPVQRPFEPTLLATDCAVNRRTHKLPLNRTLMTSKAAPVTHVAPVQTATPRLLPMTRTCLALCPWNWLVPLWTGPRFFSEICIDESLMLPSLGLRPLDGPSETWPSAIGHRHRGQRLGCSPARDYKTGLPLSTRRDMPPDPSKLAERGTCAARFWAFYRPRASRAAQFQRPAGSILTSRHPRRPPWNRKPKYRTSTFPYSKRPHRCQTMEPWQTCGCCSSTRGILPDCFLSRSVISRSPTRPRVERTCSGRGGPKSAGGGITRRLLSLIIATSEARVSLAATAGEGLSPSGLGKQRGFAQEHGFHQSPMKHHSVKSVLSALPGTVLGNRWQAAPLTEDSGSPEPPYKLLMGPLASGPPLVE